MATKKRKIPAAVLAHRERKAQMNASLAQRQGAALGKSARERLKPLVNAASEELSVTSSLDLASLNAAVTRDAEAWVNNTRHLSWSFKPFPVSWPVIRFDVSPIAPTIKADRIDALKSAAPYKPRPRIPDMVEVITGWRGWALSGKGRLEALGQSHEWPVRQALIAECASSRGHIAPAFHCSCGIWAFKDLDRLIAAIGSGYNSVKVIGSVSLWGRVIETENGYRAQYAYPSELWLLDPELEELGLIYGVPVRR